MSPLKKLFQRNKKPVLRRVYDTFMNEGNLLCLECGIATSLAHQEPLGLVKCAGCRAAMLAPLLVDDYFIIEPIGAGGLATVYRALDRETLLNEVAIKILQPAHRDTPDFVADFRREAEIHSQIPPHPNVVTYIAHGEQDGYHYQIMERLFGTRLQSQIERQGKLPESEALEIFDHVTEGLIHIHRHGILYRDVNAGNIMVDVEGHVTLIDFGLSLTVREASLKRPAPKHIDGTMAFIPPERLYGEPEDQRSIIYSLGQVLFFALSGESYFKGNTAERTAARHVSTLRLSYAPSLPQHTRELTVAMIEHMIQPQPEGRHATLEEVQADIRRCRGIAEG